VGGRDLGAALTAPPAPAAPGPIRLVNLTLGYDRHPAVHHLDGVIAPGAALAVCGPNGAGKSTLLKALAGLLPPLGGHIERNGADARDVAYLPQLADIDRDFPIDLRDFVALGATRRVGLLGRMGAAETMRTTRALQRVGLEGLEERTIGSLSGGQMQRALFARLIVQDQPVILLDEPFGAIDETTADELLGLIAEWIAERRSVVAVLHDLDLARRAFPQTLLLARRRIAWGPTSETLTPENLARARAMSAAYDKDARECLIDETATHDH
jgi:zinc/manganese transport system ATP-binding protein